MTGEITAPLKKKFQLRMTEQEAQMLVEITKQQYPESEHAQSMMIRRLIRQEWQARQARQG